ncbi:MAG: indolepyruvate oxidoreductase subunit beta family protein [Proteobacteria bacterium]|nr:indolepyruvate oxidoreductase subunit beta family protein [Pseudomonadota bacterium]
MERSFEREVASLAMGAGEVFRGEGVVAVAKALLQSGVSYVGGYQGSPVSQLLDVMVEARPYLATLGVHVEPCTNEAAACALLAASVDYPLRGAVTWKSIVGSNVAADALSNIASPGVQGGALVIVGEDYGEGSSVVQERTHAFAMKSSLPLLDPRPDLTKITDLVQLGFELAEAAGTPVLLALRIRACHLLGSFVCRDNVAAPHGAGRDPLAPAAHDPRTMSHPPHTFAHERDKVERRLPAARRFIAERMVNEVFEGDVASIGIVVQGGLYNALVQAFALAGLDGVHGRPRIGVLVLNATYPLVPGEIVAFAHGRRAVLVLEEGYPEFIEFELAAMLANDGEPCAVRGKAAMGAAGEYTTERIAQGLAAFVAEFAPEIGLAPLDAWRAGVEANRAQARALLGGPVPLRPPGFCIGCPERPVFSALKLIERELGPRHVAADIGCHSFAMFEPFRIGNTITGYGLGLASAAAVAPASARRPLATVGDGGFWHNGFLSGVTSAVKNGSDSVLLVFKNGYTSATGTQELVSTPAAAYRDAAGGASTTASDTSIERVLREVGVGWVRTIASGDVARMRSTLTEAFTTPAPGLKVVIADGECQLERQRRLRAAAARGVVPARRVRYGIDPDVCNGDRACVRLSGCPSLTVAPAPDPFAAAPVTTIDSSCVGCGLCGELAKSAALCPSFYRVESVTAPTLAGRWRERLAASVRSRRRAPREDRGGVVPDRTRISPAAPVASGVRDSPLRIAIAALGGQGGGVLSGWLVEAARSAGWRAQATSIPGVSQRTGATTYYVELAPPAVRLPRWIPSLAPVPGEVDVLVGGELLEAARMIERGMSSPALTTIVASTHRQLTTLEKMSGADGRFDAAHAVSAARALSKRAVLLDLEAIRARHRSVISAALFGALAGAGVLPFDDEACRRALGAGGAGGAGAQASLAAFDDAASAVRAADARAADSTHAPAASPGRAPTLRVSADLEAAIGALPAEAGALARQGVAALIDFQGPSYARLMLARLARVAVAEAGAASAGDGAEPDVAIAGARSPVTSEVARRLVAWMRYDDLIRVADLKTRASRFERIRREAGVGPGAPLRVDDFFSPGAGEIAAILPRPLGAWLERRARRSPRRPHKGFSWPTSSFGGTLVLRAVAALRPLRPWSLRYAREMRAIEAWLDGVVAALAPETEHAPGAALELARLPRLVRGYGDTQVAGRSAYERIFARYREAASAGSEAALGTLRRDAHEAFAGGRCVPQASPPSGGRRPATRDDRSSDDRVEPPFGIAR